MLDVGHDYRSFRAPDGTFQFTFGEDAQILGLQRSAEELSEVRDSLPPNDPRRDQGALRHLCPGWRVHLVQALGPLRDRGERFAR